jgi:hypothetical protein
MERLQHRNVRIHHGVATFGGIDQAPDTRVVVIAIF